MLRALPIVTVALLLITAGCMPEAKPPTVEGPVDSTTASKLLGEMRRSHGPKYTANYTYDDKPFEGYWELGNTLKKNAQLQLKPPGEWSQADVYNALQIAMEDFEYNPWYSQIDDTVMRLYRSALEDENNRAIGMAPDTPYDIAVKVKQYSQEWFVEVKVQILDENGMALGI